MIIGRQADFINRNIAADSEIEFALSHLLILLFFQKHELQLGSEYLFCYLDCFLNSFIVGRIDDEGSKFAWN